MGLPKFFKRRKQKTENRKQKTENRKQKTENRKQKTENRKQKTENRKQPRPGGLSRRDVIGNLPFVAGAAVNAAVGYNGVLSSGSVGVQPNRYLAQPTRYRGVEFCPFLTTREGGGFPSLEILEQLPRSFGSVVLLFDLASHDHGYSEGLPADLAQRREGDVWVLGNHPYGYGLLDTLNGVAIFSARAALQTPRIAYAATVDRRTALAVTAGIVAVNAFSADFFSVLSGKGLGAQSAIYDAMRQAAAAANLRHLAEKRFPKGSRVLVVCQESDWLGGPNLFGVERLVKDNTLRRGILVAFADVQATRRGLFGAQRFQGGIRDPAETLRLDFPSLDNRPSSTGPSSPPNASLGL